MHTLSTSFVLGYHGCDEQVAEALLRGEDFKPSDNDYDWLGGGTYFWEANPRRGLEFASEVKRRNEETGPATKINNPAVVGAVIDLGFCLDLTTSTGISAVRDAFQIYSQAAEDAEVSLPKNEGGKDLLRRKLDCAVINTVQKLREKTGQKPFDSVKGVFVEGERIYEGAGLFEKTHCQICVRNSECIKGVFRVPNSSLLS